MTPLMAYLRTLTSPRFPVGLLVILGATVLITGDREEGMVLLGLAVGWYYLEQAVGAYGARGDQTVVMSALKWLGLLLVWAGMWWRLS